MLHAAAVASVKSSCESVVESFVSKYEFHSNSRRNLDEKALSDEFMIAQNGPVFSKCDKIVERSLSQLFGSKSKWHFTRRQGTLFQESLVIKRIKSEKSHLPFVEI